MHIQYNMDQTFLPLDLSAFLSSDHPVFTIHEMVESLEEKTFQTFYRELGRPSYHPRVLLKALLYAYSIGVTSGRKIETLMEENIPMIWLTGHQVISYRTINRFRVSDRIDEALKEIYATFAAKLKFEQLITQEHLFIDGTKIEADANKYTFVWKKATEKFYARLKQTEISYYEQEIAPLIQEEIQRESEEEFSKENIQQLNRLLTEELEKTETELDRASNKETASVLKKKRRTLKKVRRKIRQDFLVREEKYETYLKTFSGRNSFSKTDTDATFMRMKDDHMMNGQLKPGYNIQIGTENQYVLQYGVFPNPTDTRTLIPFIENFFEGAPLPKNVIADAGYGSEENLEYLENKGLNGLVKFGFFDQEKKKKYRESDRNLANWQYQEEQDVFFHPDGTPFYFQGHSKRKTSSGYEQSLKIYRPNSFVNHDRKSLTVNFSNEKRKETVRQKLSSDEGRKLFNQRKIDVETVFGQVKANFGFRRFSVRGKEKVHRETGILFMAHNLRKYAKRKGHT